MVEKSELTKDKMFELTIIKEALLLTVFIGYNIVTNDRSTNWNVTNEFFLGIVFFSIVSIGIFVISTGVCILFNAICSIIADEIFS